MGHQHEWHDLSQFVKKCAVCGKTQMQNQSKQQRNTGSFAIGRLDAARRARTKGC